MEYRILPVKYKQRVPVFAGADAANGPIPNVVEILIKHVFDAPLFLVDKIWHIFDILVNVRVQLESVWREFEIVVLVPVQPPPDPPGPARPMALQNISLLIGNVYDRKFH